MTNAVESVSESDLDALVADARARFAAAVDGTALENEKARFLGKSGALTELLKGLGKLDADTRRRAGARINVVKTEIESLLTARRQALAAAELDARLSAEAIDVTLPGRGPSVGGIHPVTRTWRRIEEIFRSIGFDVADGPEIETDWMSFTALNNPENHPARSMQDTFYVDIDDAEGRPLNLRPHTSPMQVRYARMHAERLRAAAAMRSNGDAQGASDPASRDIRVIAPGRTYRIDNDATHSPMFHQVEGLWLGENISFADLKGVYTAFLTAFFETDALSVRFRPSYFPFTEPSAEIDMRFETGRLAGRWLEVSGSGQVHPRVVANFGLDPARHIGFAFGSGIDRLAMLRYGIDDLGLFFENDLRFLEQFQ